MNKINPEAKTKIVEALRSGNYTQGIGQLRTNQNCFCVWGVICDVSGKGKWETDSRGDGLYVGEARTSSCSPPQEVEAWVGTTDEGAVKVTIDDLTADLMTHNDQGHTFEELANAIEEQL